MPAYSSGLHGRGTMLPPMSSYPPPPPPPQQTPYGYPLPPEYLAGPGFPRRKRRVWVIVLSIVAGLVLLFVLFVAGIVIALFATLKSSEPYQHAMGVVTHDARAGAALGTPVTAKWYVSGNISVSNSSGNADLQIPVSGGHARGTVYVVAKKSAGRWSYQTLELEVDGQAERINLRSQSDSPLEK